MKKDELKVGDKVVYFEVDSLLPEDNKVFDFLKNQKGHIPPLKARRILSVVSQGLVLPISEFPILRDAPEGADVTDVLKVKKYDPPEFDGKGTVSTIGPFPHFIHKTDEERVQTLQELLDKVAGLEFIATEKVDGTSTTMYVRDGHIGICSRNNEVSLDIDGPHKFINEKYHLVENMKKIRDEIGVDFAVQGELLGPKIQSNKYKLNTLKWYLFNVINLETGEEFGLTEDSPWSIQWMAQHLNVDHVPFLGKVTMTNNIESLLTMAKGTSQLLSTQNREGIVFRACDRTLLPLDVQFACPQRLSFKAINEEFLVK